MNGFSTREIYEISEMFALILSAWIVNEVDEGDVTVWEDNGSSPYYITFDPVVFRFLLRGPGDSASPMESIVGVQLIDLLSLVDCPDDLNIREGESSESDVIYSDLYLLEVLRYWMYVAQTHQIIERTFDILSVSERVICVDNINRAYRYLMSEDNESELSSRLIFAKNIVVRDERYEFGSIGLH
jgi:hypothetical protein